MILRKIFVYLYVLCDQDLGDNSKISIKIAEVSLTTLIIYYIINYQMIMKCFYLKAVTQGNFFLQLTTIVCNSTLIRVKIRRDSWGLILGQFGFVWV